MLTTIILIIILIIVIFLIYYYRNKYVKNIEYYNNLDCDTEYKDIDNDFYNKVCDVTQPRNNRVLVMNNGNSKVNIKLESDDYHVTKEDGEINVINTVNPKREEEEIKNPLQRKSIFTGISDLLKHYSDDYSFTSEHFFRK